LTVFVAAAVWLSASGGTARSAATQVPVERTAEAAETFGQVIGQIRKMKNLAAAYLLVNADSGRVLTMTLWDSAAAMEASRVTASHLEAMPYAPCREMC
jgi:heme-degrading monooxygenase HmoA